MLETTRDTTNTLYFCPLFVLKPTMAVFSGLEPPTMISINYLPFLVVLVVFLFPLHVFFKLFMIESKPKGVVWSPPGKTGIISVVQSAYAGLRDLPSVLLGGKAMVMLTERLNLTE